MFKEQRDLQFEYEVLLNKIGKEDLAENKMPKVIESEVIDMNLKEDLRIRHKMEQKILKERYI